MVQEMETTSRLLAFSLGDTSGGDGGLNWGDEYECPILQGVTMAEA
jgi:hypothetical protein